MNLGHIPLDHIPIRRGKDRKRYYQFQFEIHATYFSAHCKYTLGTGEKITDLSKPIMPRGSCISSITHR